MNKTSERIKREDGDRSGSELKVNPSETRILVVDDEPTLRLSFGFALENEGYLVESAADGDEALERLKNLVEEQPAAMLLDLRMPGKSGLDVLREMKAEDLFVPSVIVSAYIDSPTAVEAVDLGVVDFLKKPVTPDQIRGAIGKMLAEEKQFAEGGGESEAAVARARWFLRRREADKASDILRESGLPESDADAAFWRMLSEHLKACRDPQSQKTEFASSRFYQAADLLGMLAYNR